jgi:hypothetical protein
MRAPTGDIMNNRLINNLLHSLAQQELQLQASMFLSPCLKGGRIRTKIAGMIYQFRSTPRDFEGWGIFQPIDAKKAILQETADLWQIDEYLKHFATLRVRLVYQLKNQTWIAYPINEADMRQRFGAVRPVVVHLVSEGAVFDVILVRSLGAAFFFETVDRKADPIHAEALQQGIQALTPVEILKFAGLTPEMRTAYEMVTKRIAYFNISSDEVRLRDALKTGGGLLDRFYDRGDFWTVEWRTGDGEAHTSSISKQDLTVMTAGICLDDFDTDFDLQSLVGVVEQRYD